MGMLFIMTSAPKVQHRQAPTRDEADSSIRAYLERRYVQTHDANDMLYQFDASRDYDPSQESREGHGAGLAINSADDFVNPPELGIVEQLMPRVKHGKFVLLADHRPDARARHAFAARGLEDRTSPISCSTLPERLIRPFTPRTNSMNLRRIAVASTLAAARCLRRLASIAQHALSHRSSSACRPGRARWRLATPASRAATTR